MVGMSRSMQQLQARANEAEAELELVLERYSQLVS